MNKLREVRFSLFEPLKSEEARPNMEHKHRIKKGYFHRWGQYCEGFNQELLVIALIEDTNGYMHEKSSCMFKFVHRPYTDGDLHE